MPVTCSSCQHPTDRYVKRRLPSGSWQVTCHVCAKPRHAGPGCLNPFSDLRLDHAHNELGQPIQVSSLRQLRAAESRYNFKSWVANTDAKNFDTPPPAKTPDLFEQMSESGGWLHPEIAEGMVAEMREAGEI